MRKYISTFLFLYSISSFAQQPDFKGAAVYGSDTFDIFFFKRIKPIESPPPPVSTCSVKGIRRYLTPFSWGGLYINGKDYKYNPGDTLVIRGQWPAGVAIENFHGTVSCPVVIINEGYVILPAGINMRHCTFIKLTGSGAAAKYGIDVSGDGTGPGIEITGRSANIDIERINVYHKAYGVWCKEETNCADSLQYPNWWIDNISLHDCSFVNIGQDGLYFGSTSPTGQRSITCNGVTITPVPLRLSNIRIYNCIVDSCNRTGIQVSGADRGNNEIYNNTVLRCGFELNQTQGSGIILGGMTRAYVHDNYIRQTFQFAISGMGSGRSRIENNNVDSSGMLGRVLNFGYTSIGIDTRSTVPANDSVGYVIRNNIIGKNSMPDGTQMQVSNSNGTFFTSGNIISGNKTQAGEAAKIYVAPSIKWSAQ